MICPPPPLPFPQAHVMAWEPGPAAAEAAGAGEAVGDAKAVDAAIAALPDATPYPAVAQALQLNVHSPVVVTVKVSPPVLMAVGALGQKVVNTTSSSTVIVGVHVRTVVQGVCTVNVCSKETSVVGAVSHVAVKVSVT